MEGSTIPAGPSLMWFLTRAMWKRLAVPKFVFDLCVFMFCFMFVFLTDFVDLTSIV